MVYIVGKGRIVSVNVVKGGKVISTFSVHKKRMHGDNIVYDGKEYPLQDGNIINIDGKSVAVPPPPPKTTKVVMSKSFRDWDKSVAERTEAKKKTRGGKK